VLEGRFDFIVGGDEVQKGKPSPDIYLRLLELSSISAINCIAIEDSFNGVCAAQAAGVLCLAYKNPTSGEQDLSTAYGIINNLKQIFKYIT
jgi:beta-phosphoglucomutase-like phosphatase (HAD superfamily)